MDNTANNIIERDLSDLFGFNELTDDERTAMLNDIGLIVFESALLQLISELDEAVASEFETYVEKNADSDTFIKDILATYPRLEELVIEEATEFKKEAVSVLEK